jgi:hypothetical protein
MIHAGGMMTRLGIVYLEAILKVRVHLACSAPHRGSSAVEWVIITAIVAGTVLGLVTLVKSLVAQRMGAIQVDW